MLPGSTVTWLATFPSMEYLTVMRLARSSSADFTRSPDRAIGVFSSSFSIIDSPDAGWMVINFVELVPRDVAMDVISPVTSAEGVPM